MNRKKYKLLQMPLMAFFSKRIYRDVGRNWKGANLAYLFLLLAVCCIPAAIGIRREVQRSARGSHLAFLDQIPEIDITNGTASIDQREPIYLSNGGTPFAILDTTGSMNYIEDENIWALLTESELIVRLGKRQFGTLDLSRIANLHIDRQVVAGWIRALQESIAPLSYGVFLLLSYILAVLVLLVVAVVGLILSMAMRAALGYSGILRIATVAATPSIIFVTLSATLGHPVPVATYVAVTLVYLVAGIASCANGAANEEDQIDLKAVLHQPEPPLLEEAA